MDNNGADLGKVKELAKRIIDRLQRESTLSDGQQNTSALLLQHETLVSDTFSLVHNLIAELNTQEENSRSKKRKVISPSASRDKANDSFGDMDVEPQYCSNEQNFANLQKKLESMDQKLDTIMTGKRSSYAQVAGASGADFRRNENRGLPSAQRSVTLRGEKTEKGVKLSGETLKTMMYDLACVKDGASAMELKVRPMHLLVVVRSQAEAETVREQMEGIGIAVVPLGERAPHLVIPNVRTEEPTDTLVTKIIGLNPDLEIVNKEDFKVVARRKNNKTSTETLIVRTVLSTAWRFKNGGKIYLPGQRLTCFLDDEVLQCWNCRKLGHSSARCTATRYDKQTGTMCPRCGEVHLEQEPCKKGLSCSNCDNENKSRLRRPGAVPLDLKHASNDFKKCPTAKKMKDIIRSQIFGDSR